MPFRPLLRLRPSAAFAAAPPPPRRCFRAVVVPAAGPPAVMRVDGARAPLPPPASGQVEIEVEVAGVNPYDTYQRAGAYMRDAQPAFPFVPGGDAAGTVLRAGAGARLAPGDRVYTLRTLSGAYAERALVDARHCWRLPDNVSFREGASTYPRGQARSHARRAPPPAARPPPLPADTC